MPDVGGRLLTGAMVLAGLVLLLAALAWVGQRHLVYFPSQVLPATVPDGVAEVSLGTDDGLSLAAWFVAPPSATVTGATIVVFHGNGGNRAGRLPLATALADRGHAVLLVDYRGYGGNPGSPSAAGLELDARAAWDWVVDHELLDPERVVFLGESLGAGVAIELALDHPPAALVLRSPFTSLADIARVHYPIVPSVLLRDRWPNLERIGELAVPVLFVAGSDDEIVPTEQTRRLHAAAAQPKRLLVVEGAGHNDRALLDGDELVTAIDEFLAAQLPSD